MGYETIAVTPVTPRIGANVEGLTLSMPLSNRQVEELHQALAEHWPMSSQSWRTMSHALMWKHWSPMSVGAWALLIFGICSFLSLLGSLWPTGRLSRWLRGAGRACAK